MLTHVKWKTDNRTQTCSHSSCFLLCACSTSSHIAFTLEKLWHIIFQNIYKIYFNYIIIYLQLSKTALKNWCFQTVVLEKTLKSPLDSNEIQPVHSKDQSWVFFGRTDSKAEAPYFDHLMWRVDSLEKTLMLGGIEGRRRRGRQRMR